MFERFTDRARRVVVLAQEEARLLDHGHIGTEHLLLGLIHEQEGVAAKALSSLGISLESVRTEVEGAVGRGDHTASDRIPFTPRAKKVLELSLREAIQLGHDYIGTEHILLGLIREGTGVGARTLQQFGLTLPSVRTAVLDTLADPAFVAARTERMAREFQDAIPARCAVCGAASPECGTLFTTGRVALVCERCLVRLRDRTSE